MAEDDKPLESSNAGAEKRRNREEVLRLLEEAMENLREAEIAWAEARAYRKAASL